MRPSFLRGCTAALAIGLGVGASPTDAQTIPSPYRYIEARQELGIMAGVLDAATGRFGYGPSGGTRLAARYGVELSGPLSFEGIVGVVDGTRDVVDPGRAEGDRVIGQADSRLTTVEARIKFTFTGRRSWNDLAPFFVFGGGVAFDVAAASELDDILLAEDVFDFGTSFFGTLGIGSRWFLTERFALLGEGTFSLWKIDTPPGFSDPSRGFEGVSDGEWTRGTQLTLTLLYRW